MSASTRGLVDFCVAQPAEEASPAAVMDSDLTLIDAMIANSTQALAVASDGLVNAQDSQVRRIALRVAESQAGELLLLRAWRSAWFPSASPIALIGSDQVSLDHPPGAPYDRAFLEAMMASFEGAIELANVAADHAERSQLRDFARTIIATRQSEIELIRQWLPTQAGTPTASICPP